MKILILHPNFPGQFKNVAQHFAEIGHDVIFLCQTHYNRTIKGVNRICLKGSLGNQSLNELSLKASDRAIKMGEQYLEAFKKLVEKKWTPDLVISHSGWGCGAYTRYVWPETKIISYLEWWFNSTSEIYNYEQKNKFLGLNSKSSERHLHRNASIALELSYSDQIVSPTKWQRSQLPEIFRKRCQVVYDGVNIEKFQDCSKKSGLFSSLGQYISYGTRGMEPMRAFPQFIQSIPLILQKRPELKVIIAGNDEINYGGMKPSAKSSWKQWAIKFLETSDCSQNVIWTGRLTEEKYLSWLSNSCCHVYLTHPYVLSWSFIDSLICCDKVVASDVKPVQEFIDFCQFNLVDHRDSTFIASVIDETLTQSHTTTTSQRQVFFNQLGLQACMRAWEAVAGLKVTTEH